MDFTGRKEKPGFNTFLMWGALLSLLSVLLPFIGIIPAIFLPLPMILLRLEGQKAAQELILAFVMLFIPVFLTGRIGADLIFYLAMLFYGYLISEGWRRGLNKEKFTIRAILYLLLALFLLITLIALTRGETPLSLVSNSVRRNLELGLKLYKQMDIPEDILLFFEDSLPQIEYLLTRLLPAISVMLLLIAAWLNLLVAKSFVKIWQIKASDLGFFRNWALPQYFIWGFILAAFLILVPYKALYIMGASCLLLLFPLYFFQGMAVLAFWFHTKKTPKAIRYTLYALMLIQQIFLLLLFFVGIFDTWFNFRKKIQRASPS